MPSASAANTSGFVQIPLSQVPRRVTFASTRVLGAGALVDQVIHLKRKAAQLGLEIIDVAAAA